MQRRLAGLMASALAAVSCQPTGQAQPVVAPASEGATAVPAQPAAARVISLAGDWRVAGIDGREFDEPYGLALKGDQERLWWEPLCALQARRYRIEGAAVRFTLAFPPPRRGDPPPLICLVAPPARLTDVMRALDAAQSIERTPQNGILIAGGGHSLLLFSQ